MKLTKKLLIVAALFTVASSASANTITTEWIPNTDSCIIDAYATFSNAIGSTTIAIEGGIATETEVPGTCDSVERPPYLIKMDKKLTRLENKLFKAKTKLERLIQKGKTKKVERQRWYIKWLQVQVKSQKNWIAWLEDFFGIEECNPETKVTIEASGSSIIAISWTNASYDNITKAAHTPPFSGLSIIADEYVRLSGNTEVTEGSGEITINSANLTCD